MDELSQITELRALGDPDKAAEMAAYHKAPRAYLGVAVPVIDGMAREWRSGLDVAGRVDLAQKLWDSDVHEARVAAAKLLTQARIRPDDQVWDLIVSWVPAFDGWAIADQVMKAGEKRLVADPTRLDQVEAWLDHPSHWVRRAAVVGTWPWTHIRNPKPAELSARERVLGWFARLAGDREGLVQKAIGDWLRDLSKHDPERVREWVDAHGALLRPAARREALRWVRVDQP